MGYTFYDGTVPFIQGALASLSACLTKAEKHASETSTPADSLITARLIEDMYPLAFQVHVACDTAVKFVARVHDTEPASIGSWETLDSFAGLQDRIAKAQEILKTASPDKFVERTDAVVTFGVGKGKTADLPARDYAKAYSMPNVFFHVQTTYSILRMKGVPVGKMDYLSGFQPTA